MLLQYLISFSGSLTWSTPLNCSIVFMIVLLTIIAIAIKAGDISSMQRNLKHLQKVGSTVSNMADQYDSRFDIPETAAKDTPIRIKAIYIHPVKSCGPIELDGAFVTKAGFMYDRCFAVAVEKLGNDLKGGSEWQFISQRTKPGMARIKTELWLPREQSDLNDPLVRAGGCVVLSFEAPDPPSWINRMDTFLHTWSSLTKPQTYLTIPLQPTPVELKRFKIGLEPFKIHSREAKGLNMGRIPSVAAGLPKLTKALGLSKNQRLTIFKCTSDTLTRTDRNLAPLENIGSPAVHGYTDQQPININSLSSVHAVSALLPPENRPLNALRFRANIWITGAPAFAEESWKRYRILPKARSKSRVNVAPTLSVVCRTSRCTMPNVNPDTGLFDADNPPPDKKKGKPQPSTTLVAWRTVEDGNPKALGYLGMHCVPEDASLKEAEENGGGLCVQVGDEIEVLEEGIHLYGSTASDY